MKFAGDLGGGAAVDGEKREIHRRFGAIGLTSAGEEDKIFWLSGDCESGEEDKIF